MAAVLRLLMRMAGWLVFGVLGLAVLLVLAWLPFNWRDAQPRALPAELQLPAPRVADDRNAAYGLEGLFAPAERDPAATGRAVWAEQRARHALPPAQRAASAGEAHAVKIQQLMSPQPPRPQGPPLHCAGSPVACDADWLAQAAALARQRSEYGVLGERCDRLVDGPLEFEELPPAGRGADAPIMAWLPMSECSRWLRSGAIAALGRGKRSEVLAQLQRADRLHTRLWQGSRTLIGYMVSTRLARQTYDTMIFAAMRDPALAESMLPWLAAPLDTREGARRWMAVEAEFQRGAIGQVRDASGAAPLASASAPFQLGEALLAVPLNWLAGRGIGLLPELTAQRIDDTWRRRVVHLQQYVWPAILAGAADEYRAQQRPGAWTAGLQWRNTFGAMLTPTAEPHYAGYFARHADHELHREAAALVLALIQQRVAPAQRAEAARKLPGASDVLKERMSWAADGQVLTVRPWQSETPGATYDPRRDAITFNWLR